MIADEVDLSLRPRERQMIGSVARRCNRLQRPALPFDDVAVLDLDVGPEIAVGAGFRIVLLALEARPRGAMLPLGMHNQQPDHAVQLIDRPVGRHARMILTNPAAVTQPGLTLVARLRVYT